MPLSTEELKSVVELAQDDVWMSLRTQREVQSYMKTVAYNLIHLENLDLTLDLAATVLEDPMWKWSFKKSCLPTILKLFDSLEIVGGDRYTRYAEKVVDIMLAVTKEKSTINDETVQAIIQKVINWIVVWRHEHGHLCMGRLQLQKKVLLLGKSIVYGSTPRQLMFVSRGGLMHVRRYLEMPFEWNRHDPCLKSPGNAVIDAPRSLFSSISWLLDAIIIGNQAACKESYAIGVTEVLLKCLDTVPTKELEGVISALVHTAEAKVCVFTSDHIKKMYEVTQAIDFRKNEVDDHVTQFIGEWYSSICIPQSRFISSLSKKCGNIKIPALASEKKLKQIKVGFKGKMCKHRSKVISAAEIMILMQCVGRYGVNMNEIRKVYPFHLEMTPYDLYTFWRGMWGLPPSSLQ